MHEHMSETDDAICIPSRSHGLGLEHGNAAHRAELEPRGNAGWTLNKPTHSRSAYEPQPS